MTDIQMRHFQVYSSVRATRITFEHTFTQQAVIHGFCLHFLAFKIIRSLH